ncbi:glycosyltransferase [Flavobacterium sp.]|uniref:glycosyltransferase n=1 Tax=Flavobacterium sp. TaxID=239 RepID=UPI00352793BA
MSEIKNRKRILVAPLNWGLGHATRCIPIIKALEQEGFEPIIASDGKALELLQKEFPTVESVTLPSYSIKYAKKGSDFKWKMIFGFSGIAKAIKKERKQTKQLIDTLNIDGIISDNRLGVNHTTVPTVYITHQVNVIFGNLTWLSSKAHRYYMNKFSVCWVPDKTGRVNISGKLGHINKTWDKLNYIGPLSRFEEKKVDHKYDVAIVLSGPEPQRSILEQKLITELTTYNGTVLFVKGVVEEKQKCWVEDTVTYYNFMESNQLEEALNESAVVLSRSGYTTIMDLAKLNKKAYFIPTPGQYEQEYLAKRLKKYGYAPSCKQDDFTFAKLEEIVVYKGLHQFVENNTDWPALFSLF